MAEDVKLDPANVKADKNGTLNVDISPTITDEFLTRLQKLDAVTILNGLLKPQHQTLRSLS